MKNRYKAKVKFRTSANSQPATNPTALPHSRPTIAPCHETEYPRKNWRSRLKLGPLGPNLSLLRQFFLGYSVSWHGAIVGLLWGSAVGFVAGWLFALVRNFTLALYLFFIKTQAERSEER